MKTFLMLHGINHNMFGKRDPKQYGTITLDEINARLKSLAAELLAIAIDAYQDQQRSGDGRAHPSGLRGTRSTA